MQLPFSALDYQRVMRWVSLAVLALTLSVSVLLLFRMVPARPLLVRFQYGEKVFHNYYHVRKEFRPRLGSTSVVRAFYTRNPRDMRQRIAWFFALWFLACCLVYVLTSVRAAPFLMLGTFAAIYYNCTPAAEHIWHPWDMPALFFSALVMMFAYRRITWGLAATIFGGIFFKETILVFGLLLLFFDNISWKRRLIWCFATLAIGYGIRHGIETYVHNPEGFDSFSYHINGNPHQMFRWQENLKWLTSSDINNVLFVNLGTLVFLFILPTRGDRVLLGFKAFAAIFYVSLFFAGSFNEFRIFIEALPGGLLLMYTALQPVPAPAAAVASAPASLEALPEAPEPDDPTREVADQLPPSKADEPVAPGAQR